jgi:glucose-1-phosphate thymidylyltransferase
MKAIIPTGGMGTRMRPLTFTANKHLIPVANKPLIHYPIETIIKAGITDIILTYNPGQYDIMYNFLGDGSAWGAKFTYILQENPRGGLANIFQVCQSEISGKPFCMHLGDNIFTEGIDKLVKHFTEKKPKGLVGIVHHPENTRLGVPYFDKSGRLVKYVEKPENPPHDYAIPGIYFFDPIIFDAFTGKGMITPSSRGEMEIASAFQWLIDHKHTVDTLEIDGVWLDPGKVDDWLSANLFLLDLNTKNDIKSDIDKTNSITGRVTIGTNCTIKNSKIKGPVNIGQGVTIIDSVINPYTSISDNSTIIGSRVSDSVIMAGVSIDRVKRSIEHSLIGPGANVSQNQQNDNSIELLIGELSKLII